MSPNLRRYLPYIIVAFVLLLVLPAIFDKKTTSTAPTPASQSTETLAVTNSIDRSELTYHRSHGRYSEQLADLLTPSDAIAQELTSGITVQLDVSTDGQTYDVLVQSPVLAVFRARRDGKLLTEGCTVIKASSGVSCPTPTTAHT